MKLKGSQRFLILLFVFFMFSLTACGADKNSGEATKGSTVTPNSGSPMSNSESYVESNRKKNDDVEVDKMISAKITVGNKVFAAKFYNKEIAQAFLARLPMTVNMTELNGKEKYYNLSESLPVKSTEAPATINAGEIMCWSSNTLVLFYNTYSNSHGGYVKLGYIEDISGLKEALGKANVQVAYEMSN